MNTAASIRFKHGALDSLRDTLLADLGNEAFALLLGKRHDVGGTIVVTVHDVRYPQAGEYRQRSLTSIHPDKGFVYRVMTEAQQRLDVDTVIDVHTHPFADAAWFSGTDSSDESEFCAYLADRVGGDIHYGSIVLSRRAYGARLWTMHAAGPRATRAVLKTQTVLEAVPEGACLPEGNGRDDAREIDLADVQSRTALALGVDTLHRIAGEQFIVLAGVGGLGSVMAENLVHQGFSRIGLIDPDALELSNLNRFVGARHDDALNGRAKVEVVKEHLFGINPDVRVQTLAEPVDAPEALAMMAGADWILLSTDTHASSYVVQRTASTYFVPLISAGVNITVERTAMGYRMTDRSGEVIVVRAGDGFCLQCLGRINFARMAAERHPDPQVRELTQARGYVQGLDVKEPAVKTLNALIGALAVERLVDQYRPAAVHDPIMIYESHDGACLYPDRDTFELLRTGCSLCRI